MRVAHIGFKLGWVLDGCGVQGSELQIGWGFVGLVGICVVGVVLGYVDNSALLCWCCSWLCDFALMCWCCS